MKIDVDIQDSKKLYMGTQNVLGSQFISSILIHSTSSISIPLDVILSQSVCQDLYRSIELQRYLKILRS